jgi:hypothetical protein
VNDYITLLARKAKTHGFTLLQIPASPTMSHKPFYHVTELPFHSYGDDKSLLDTARNQIISSFDLALNRILGPNTFEYVHRSGVSFIQFRKDSVTWY